MSLIDETEMLRYLYPRHKERMRVMKQIRNYVHPRFKLQPWMREIIEEEIAKMIKESED